MKIWFLILKYRVLAPKAWDATAWAMVLAPKAQDASFNFGCFSLWKENVFLRNLRTKFDLSSKIVVATALARMWEDVDIQGEGEDDDAGDEGDDDDYTEEIIVDDAAIATIRQRGKILRDKLKDEMPLR